MTKVKDWPWCCNQDKLQAVSAPPFFIHENCGFGYLLAESLFLPNTAATKTRMDALNTSALSVSKNYTFHDSRESKTSNAKIPSTRVEQLPVALVEQLVDRLSKQRVGTWKWV